MYKFRTNQKIIMVLLTALVLAVTTPLVGCAPSTNVIDSTTQPININDYVEVNLSGYNGYGSYEVSIDYETMIKNANISEEDKASALLIATKLTTFTPIIDAPNFLSNGDIVKINWLPTADSVSALEEFINMTIVCDETYEFAVSGLTDVKELNPFDYLVCSTNKTISGQGAAIFKIELSLDGTCFSWDVKHDGENGKLSNGDSVLLTITEKIDEDSLAKDFGIRLSEKECNYKIHGLCDRAVDGDVLKYLYEHKSDSFDKVVQDWVVSGLNDENVNAHNRTYKPYGYVYYTNDNIEDECMLIAIYEIKDSDLTYYTFVGLKGYFAYDNAGVYMSDGRSLPSEFIYYEKETVRYSEKFGWDYGCEEMGFINNGVAYAGHIGAKDVFEYIESTYGVNYENRYVNQEIESSVPKR